MAITMATDCCEVPVVTSTLPVMFRIGITSIGIDFRRSILDTDTKSQESGVLRIGIENRHIPIINLKC
jgi:hypothetical protein